MEALRAVLPATFISLYSAAVILLQNAALTAGAQQQAEAQASLAKELAGSPKELEIALTSMPVEPDTFLWGRIGFAVVCLGALFFQAYRTSQVAGKHKVFLEPVVTCLAFAAWALAAPGTFLAAFLNAPKLAVWTILIASVAGVGLWVVSTTVLNKSADRRPTTSS